MFGQLFSENELTFINSSARGVSSSRSEVTRQIRSYSSLDLQATCTYTERRIQKNRWPAEKEKKRIFFFSCRNTDLFFNHDTRRWEATFSDNTNLYPQSYSYLSIESEKKLNSKEKQDYLSDCIGRYVLALSINLLLYLLLENKTSY